MKAHPWRSNQQPATAGGLPSKARALVNRDEDRRIDEDGTTDMREPRNLMRGLQEELRRMNIESLELLPLAAVGKMTTFISHDLRNHLSVIYANLELLTDDKAYERNSPDLVEEVRSAIGDMADMLDSLLLFARTGQSLRPGLESLYQLIERAVDLVRFHPSARNVEIVIEDRPTIKSWVNGKKLCRAFFNILLNACEAASRGPEPGKVGVALFENESLIYVRVVDSGPGVPDSIREALFQPFVTDGKAHGTGLGLAIAECTARDHGGSVNLEQSIFGNTVFTLHLPKVAMEAQQ